MLLQSHILSVKDIRKETADCVSIAFEVPEELKNNYSFTQGQYITIIKEFNEESLHRNYSICTSPADNELRIAVKKIPNGVFSNYANHHLKIGDALHVMPPAGKFHTPISANQENSYIAFAAGTGITPLLSIIKTTLQTEPKSNFTLVYGNKNRYSILFKEALEALKNKYLDRFRIMYILSREKTDSEFHYGRIDEEKCTRIFKSTTDPKNIHAFFICGPEEMIFSIQAYLEKIGIEKNKIHFELFHIHDGSEKKSITQIPATSNNNISNITIQQDGRSFNFQLPFQGNSILNEALVHGADLPFACKKGVCCTCKAKLLEGEVEMERVYGLEPDEIDHGYILTCQSHPRSEKILIDFDI